MPEKPPEFSTDEIEMLAALGVSPSPSWRLDAVTQSAKCIAGSQRCTAGLVPVTANMR